MDPRALAERKRRQTLRTAQLCSILFGLAMLAWGLAPPVVHRLATGYLAPVQMLAVGSLTILIGAALVAVGAYMHRGRSWTLWIALATSLVVLAGSLTIVVFEPGISATIFPLLLALATAATCWLALEARRSDANAPDGHTS